MTENPPKTRFIPNAIIRPRCTATRNSETGKVEVHFYGDEGKISIHILTSRAAHELFDELVGALCQEGYAYGE